MALLVDKHYPWVTENLISDLYNQEEKKGTTVIFGIQVEFQALNRWNLKKSKSWLKTQIEDKIEIQVQSNQDPQRRQI